MRNFLQQQEAVPDFNKLETLFINVLDYFYKAYIKMTLEMPFNYHREDDINDKLYGYLLNVLEDDGIEGLCPIPQSYNPTQRPTHGRASQVDFLVRWSLNPRDKYQFFIECKLLNCNGKNREYYNNGIRRFETNFYANRMPFAAMIGYIERGETTTIASDLNNKIEATSTHPLTNISVDTGIPNSWYSCHQRNENDNIKLYHLFLDFRDCQNDPLNMRLCPGNRYLISPI